MAPTWEPDPSLRVGPPSSFHAIMYLLPGSPVTTGPASISAPTATPKSVLLTGVAVGAVESREDVVVLIADLEVVHPGHDEAAGVERGHAGPGLPEVGVGVDQEFVGC